MALPPKHQRAKEEAERFLARMHDLEGEITLMAEGIAKEHAVLYGGYNLPRKASSAVRRASMDLTRVLSELRRY